MLSFVPTAVFLVLFCISVRQDRRRFRNAVLFGLTLISLSIALLVEAHHLPVVLAGMVYTLVSLLPALGVVPLGGFLIANGLTMIKKEGCRPANLLSGMLGVSVFGVIFLLWSVNDEVPAYAAFARAVLLLSLYVSFLFLCFLAYAFLYGRIKVRGDVDFVVMLGSGLIGGERVPPLLASRLRKGLEIHDAQVARGAPAPILLASGGQGPDEKLPEATAMSRWLIQQGAPAGHIQEESRSRTTDENLHFSREIMTAGKTDYRCVVVTNNFHAFRAAMTARQTGVNGQVLGSPTAKYFWPSATIREFVAVFWEHKKVNLSICAALTVLAVTTVGRL
ncbi:YdcF family protein [Streptomyces tubercidicus]|uniref:YdcF family protein n=1 Tax=Streptomyces tubercidicus TaxID=47759 RepID=UPI002E1379B0|nr:YdcF family protein [Streptomyces tubercidicus]WSX21519.1 YdcF family protein [Streptomyces tubercidicus]